MFKFLPNHLKTTEEETRENISAEKEVDERNTNTSKVTNTSEVRDQVCMKSTDVKYCGDDHLNNENIIQGLVEYGRR